MDASADAPPADAWSIDDASTGFAVSVVSVESLCGGQAANVSLAVRGGTRDYTWRIEEGPPGWTLSGDHGDVVSLTHPSAPVGVVEVSVVVTDGRGKTARLKLPLDVQTMPVISTQALPTACAEIPYSVALAATGGDPNSYRFSVGASNGENATFSGNVLSVVPGKAGDLELTLQVADSHCSSPPTPFKVAITDDVAECPSITPVTLPSPCRGYPYRPEPLTPDSGTGQLTWRALELPEGLDFDPDTHTIFGVPRSAGPLALKVEMEDSAGRRAEASYSVSSREHCWFAYVSSEDGPSDLHRFDPELMARATISNTPQGAPGVIDFKFSPDGNYLLYRTRGADDLVHAVFVDADRWVEQQVDTDGTVLQYAWSGDSRTVALATQAGTKTFLSAIRIVPAEGGALADAGVDGGARTAAISLGQPTELLAPGAQFASELTWVGDEVIAFHAGMTRGTNHSSAHAYYSTLRSGEAGAAPAGFDAPIEIDQMTYAPTVYLQPGRSGFFAVQPNPAARLDFFRLSGNSSSLYQFPAKVADPAGSYAANATGNELGIYQTIGVVRPPNDPPWVEAPGCTTVLSWATARERLACEGPPYNGGSSSRPTISVFDLDATVPRLKSQVIAGTGDYGTAMSFERRRLFSPSGDWFAFTTDALVFVADLRSENGAHVHNPIAPFKDPVSPPPTPYTELLFSPDSRFLLFQQGNAVGLQRLDHIEFVPTFVSSDLTNLAQPCSENFISDANNWCGSARATTQLKWSADSLVAAGRVASGQIFTWNFSDIDNGNNDEEVACDTGCTGVFEFQP